MSRVAAYECNGKTVSAEAFYAIACDPRRSVAVEACAGAGKTWMLVSRMVRALLDASLADESAPGGGTQPHEILAITFTRRAAGEMRERLYEWLAAFVHADQATLLNELRIRGVPGLDDAAHAARLATHLSALYGRMLATGRPVQIRTFHSWFAALLRTAPVAVLQALGLPVNYELLEDDSQARALVWRRFYAALLAAPERQDFEAVVLRHGRFQADKALQSVLDKRVEFALADASGALDASVLHFTDQFPAFEGLEQAQDLAFAGAGRQPLIDAALALGQASAPSFSAKGAELERALTEQDFDGVFSALFTVQGTPRKFGEKIVGIAAVRAAQDLVSEIDEARHQHEAWLYQQRMARLSRVLIAQYTALKRERGWIDMNDVERAALVMLCDPVLSGWVQEKLDARLKHLLIDEFQDTNPLQWQALLAWLGSYGGAGQAPSVFLVGDPKQSIYRFRRAEPQVFRAAQAFVQGGLGGDLLSCDHTRRNAQSVIAAVNNAMTAAAQTDGYEGFRPHSTDSASAGEVFRLQPIARLPKAEEEALSVHWRDSLAEPRELPEETLRTLEARQAAAWLAGQLQASNGALRPDDVMVLSRKRAGLLPMLEELRRLHIPAQVGEHTALIDCCEVLDVVALLDVLVSPQHDLSLARVLRSPIFGVDDACLVQLALAQRRLDVPWMALLARDQQAGIDELQHANAAGLQGIGARLKQWKAWVDTLPPHDALQAIYDDGDVLARFAAAAPRTQRRAMLANLRALLAVALEQGGGRFATPYALVRALKAGSIQAPAAVMPEAARLLTVHGAKGLEAKLVLLLDTDSPPRTADSMGVLVDWPGHASAPEKFVFLVSEGRPPVCCLAALQAEQQARHREELNALYVAMTRARQTLAMSSINPHRDPGASWWRRLLDLTQEVAAQEIAAIEVAPGDASSVTFALPHLPLAPVIAVPARVLEPVDPPSARIGKAMHRLLEWGTLGQAQVRAAAREFRLDAAQAQAAAAAAERILRGAGAWAWSPAAVSWQGNEVELAYAGQTLRLDRLVQRCDPGHEGQWWVLDYKSRGNPQDQPELIAQMQIYRAAVTAVFAGEKVRSAFLTGQGELVEVG